MARPVVTYADLWRRIEKTDACWVWTGALDREGYPVGRVNQVTVRVHRVVYAREVGPIPEGFEVDHVCQVRRCVRPDHLEAVTGAENRRRQGAAVVVCRNGHPYTELTTYVDPRGKRGCRPCRADAKARLRARKAA